jgi:hypothetical protein
MNIQPNQFFNPADCEWEVLGFFEEYLQVDLDWPKLLGCAILPDTEAPRALGSAGQISRTLTAPVQLKRGTKTILVKASPQKPIHVKCMVQAICGLRKGTT